MTSDTRKSNIVRRFEIERVKLTSYTMKDGTMREETTSETIASEKPLEGQDMGEKLDGSNEIDEIRSNEQSE